MGTNIQAPRIHTNMAIRFGIGAPSDGAAVCASSGVGVRPWIRRRLDTLHSQTNDTSSCCPASAFAEGHSSILRKRRRAPLGVKPWIADFALGNGLVECVPAAYATSDKATPGVRRWVKHLLDTDIKRVSSDDRISDVSSPRRGIGPTERAAAVAEQPLAMQVGGIRRTASSLSIRLGAIEEALFGCMQIGGVSPRLNQAEEEAYGTKGGLPGIFPERIRALELHLGCATDASGG